MRYKKEIGTLQEGLPLHRDDCSTDNSVVSLYTKTPNVLLNHSGSLIALVSPQFFQQSHLQQQYYEGRNISIKSLKLLT